MREPNSPLIRRVLVCGSHRFKNTVFVYATLDRLSRDWSPDLTVIEGDAPGVDRMAGYWARSRGHRNRKFPAEWRKHGKAAGPKRNQRMIDEGGPQLVVAFPGERGTTDMVDRAERAGIPVLRVSMPDNFFEQS